MEQNMSQSEHSPADRIGGVREAGHAAYTVSEFCDAHRISCSKRYQLWSADLGPRFIQIGTKKIVATEAAPNWRRAGEAADEALPRARRRSTRKGGGRHA
jgi:hypothetical protein